MNRAIRRLLLAALLVIILLILAPALARRLLSLPDYDFVEYWSAGRLVVSGGNPYSPPQMLAVERTQGWELPYPVMTYNPPWSLPLAVPLAAFSFGNARLLWFVLQLTCIIASAICLWSLYGGKPRSPLPIAVTLSFFPSLLALRTGQVAPLMLLGLTGFLLTVRRRPFVAGLSLALVAVKPQLLYLLWPALVLWSVHRRSWRTLLGLTCALGGASVIALAFDPSAFAQFIELTVSSPPDYVTPTLGTLLRLLFGSSRYGLQFLPCVIGLVWLLPYWRAHRAAWEWAGHLPLLILVSLATTPYGWPYDVVTALPALIQLAVAGVPLLPVLLYVAVEILTLLLGLATANAIWYFWFVPALLVIYLVATHRPKAPLANPEATGAAAELASE